MNKDTSSRMHAQDATVLTKAFIGGLWQDPVCIVHRDSHGSSTCTDADTHVVLIYVTLVLSYWRSILLGDTCGLISSTV